MALRFMMGEVVRLIPNPTRKKRKLCDLLQLLDSEPKEVVGLQNLALLLQAVNEWLCLAGSNLTVVANTLAQIQTDYGLNE